MQQNNLIFYKKYIDNSKCECSMVYEKCATLYIGDFYMLTKTADDVVVSKENEILSKAGQTLSVTTEKLKLGLGTDIEGADLAGVSKVGDLAGETLAGLIVQLEGETSQISTHFDSLKQVTTTEKIIGFFSKQKAKEMQETRIRSASIDKSLQNLLAKSDKIVTMIVEHEKIIEKNITAVTESHRELRENRKINAEKLEEVRAKIADLKPQIGKLQEQLANETNDVAKVELQNKLYELSEQHNILNKEEGTLTTMAHAYEKHNNNYAIYHKSLYDQSTTMQNLRETVEENTRQRIVQYAAISDSLKSAQIQQTGHKINEVGNAMDAAGIEIMGAVGAAANKAHADMLEAYKAQNEHIFAISEKGQKAHADFEKRYAKIIQEYKSRQ